MRGEIAGDETSGAGPEAFACGGLYRGGDDIRVGGKAEVVVGTERKKGHPSDEGALSRWTGDLGTGAPAMLSGELGELGSEGVGEVTHGPGYSPV
jgi:hypothetical protein